jgi:hypothetical protein
MGASFISQNPTNNAAINDPTMSDATKNYATTNGFYE